MRARGPLGLLSAVVLLLTFGAPSASAAPVFVLTGKGYGHGIGLSQYGAQGFAQHGWSHSEILEHFYVGATLTPGFPNDSVKVLLATGRASLTLGSAAAFTLEAETLPAGDYTLTPSIGHVTIRGSGVARTVASPATFAPGAASLELGSLPYRNRLVIASSDDGKTLAALNTPSREQYIQGVVPREMPASWEAEALAAQAVAARTYSLATGGHCLWEGGDGLRAVALPLMSFMPAPMYEQLAAEAVFCSDTRDQVYGGKSAETAATNAAVQETAGKAMTYEGSTAATYFFSTSGGRTAAKADEWGGASVPYLVSVPDPYDSISPHHAWGPQDPEVDCTGTSPDCVYTAARVQTALQLSQTPLDLRVAARNSSGRVASLEATGATTSATFTGTVSRTKLGLRSTWFSVGVLSVKPSVSTVTYGGKVTLSGLARSGGTSGWGTAHLQRKRYGESAWISLSTLADGSWSRTYTPVIRTDYRVVSGNAIGAPVTVFMRTRVTVAKPRAPYRQLSGSIGPARAGIVVTLLRQRTDGTWATWAKTTTKSLGKFSFSLSRLGTYRARADAGAGYLAGSATVTLPPG
jgi:stage II sporulation protein D